MKMNQKVGIEFSKALIVGSDYIEILSNISSLATLLLAGDLLLWCGLLHNLLWCGFLWCGLLGDLLWGFLYWSYIQERISVS